MVGWTGRQTGRIASGVKRTAAESVDRVPGVPRRFTRRFFRRWSGGGSASADRQFALLALTKCSGAPYQGAWLRSMRGGRPLCALRGEPVANRHSFRTPHPKDAPSLAVRILSDILCLLRSFRGKQAGRFGRRWASALTRARTLLAGAAKEELGGGAEIGSRRSLAGRSMRTRGHRVAGGTKKAGRG